MKLIRIIIVDDDEDMRDGIGVVLDSQPDIELVAEATSRHDALAAIEDLRPDVALVDIHLPGDDGIGIARHIAAGFPGTRVIIYSALSDRASEAVSLGFTFLLKGCELKELLAAIRSG